ncbi:amidohydrolase family protein [uncultured Piscinibacter sp.]|uniref:N-acyl-D-amino-acid deacylase family protein n=1 Tax=uncultured Piscinibacter sp. TaxID=1131835 RepID=UPI00262EC8B7|nr:D-aminoacylase [uncultured Piscinibacter sp.]
MPEHDCLLRDALLFDGSGAGRRRADVAIEAGRIVAVGDLGHAPAREVVDLSGLALAPGFIDVHTHDDRLLLADPTMAPKLSQGVTSVIAGNCGISLAPLGRREAVPPLNLVADGPAQRFDSFAAYFAALEHEPPAVNMAALVGHTTLRVVTMQALDRPADRGEIAHMQGLVREALQAGVLGLSTGTYYAPASAASAEEILAVCEPLRGSGALIASHIRDEGERVLESMTEAMKIANALGVRQVISHHKVVGRANFGRSRETLALLDQARLEGDVCLDCYPYTASSTVLRKDTARQASRTLVAWSKARPAAAGRDLDDLAREQGLDTDAMIDALQPAGAIYFSMDEADVERILVHPQTMIGSDGLPHDTFPHPRLWGAFPRVLGHYARDRHLFSLETAVHKMTGLPASRFGLQGRGLVRPGFAADLVVFDPEHVIDAATYAEPQRPASGIARVYVNGRLAWHAGAGTGARAGRVLRRAAPGASS